MTREPSPSPATNHIFHFLLRISNWMLVTSFDEPFSPSQSGGARAWRADAAAPVSQVAPWRAGTAAPGSNRPCTGSDTSAACTSDSSRSPVLCAAGPSRARTTCACTSAACTTASWPRWRPLRRRPRLTMDGSWAETGQSCRETDRRCSETGQTFLEAYRVCPEIGRTFPECARHMEADSYPGQGRLTETKRCSE